MNSLLFKFSSIILIILEPTTAPSATLQILFTSSALLIPKPGITGKFVCSFIILMCCAYAAPYLIGFNYERHITPFIVMTIFSNFMLFNISDSKYLYKKK